MSNFCITLFALGMIGMIALGISLAFFGGVTYGLRSIRKLIRFIIKR